ncbi:hypothetical protein [Amycolatopsis sp. NPDC003676]
MTVVPCLADQPLRTGHPRQTGAPPEPGEEAVLVRAPQQLGRECEPESAPRPRGAAKREKAARPAAGKQFGGADEQATQQPDGAAESDASAKRTSSERPAGKTLPEKAEPREPARSAAAVQEAEASQPSGTARVGGVRETGAVQPGEAAASNAADSAQPGNKVATEAVGSDAAKATTAAVSAAQPSEPLHPDPEHPSRVRVVVDWDPFSRPPRRIATRDEMVASAHRVLARRQHGRHRKPDTRDPWATRAADFVVAWAATLRMALLLLAGTAFLAGLVLMDSPIAGVAITSVTLAAGVAAWVARPRRSPSHRC